MLLGCAITLPMPSGTIWHISAHIITHHASHCPHTPAELLRASPRPSPDGTSTHWVVTDVIGAEDGLGVECLSGSGACASAFNRAFRWADLMLSRKIAYPCRCTSWPPAAPPSWASLCLGAVCLWGVGGCWSLALGHALTPPLTPPHLNHREGYTITLVSGRTVGIGAYLARLGRRVVQRADQPIILTGWVGLTQTWL